MRLAATGHRPNKFNNEYNSYHKDYGPMQKWIYQELQAAVVMFKPDEMITGLALGVDTIWATLALRMDIPLTCAIPCKGQERIWPKASQDYYNFILSKANKIVVVSEGGYTPAKMQIRNEWMVTHCDILVAVWDGKKSGGTYNCIRYAENRYHQIHYINLKDYEEH